MVHRVASFIMKSNFFSELVLQDGKTKSKRIKDAVIKCLGQEKPIDDNRHIAQIDKTFSSILERSYRDLDVEDAQLIARFAINFYFQSDDKKSQY